jgi:hypothetical protein
MCSIVGHRRDAEMAQLTTTQRDREFYHYRRVNHALCLQNISNLDGKSRALADLDRGLFLPTMASQSWKSSLLTLK